MQRHQVASGLWKDWDGQGFDPENDDNPLVYTLGHMSLDIKAVLDSLAVYVTQSGDVDSRNEAYEALEASTTSMLYAGAVDGDDYLTICDENGVTFLGDSVDYAVPVTLVEVNLAC